LGKENWERGNRERTASSEGKEKGKFPKQKPTKKSFHSATATRCTKNRLYEKGAVISFWENRGKKKEREVAKLTQDVGNFVEVGGGGGLLGKVRNGYTHKGETNCGTAGGVKGKRLDSQGFLRKRKKAKWGWNERQCGNPMVGGKDTGLGSRKTNKKFCRESKGRA